MNHYCYFYITNLIRGRSRQVGHYCDNVVRPDIKIEKLLTLRSLHMPYGKKIQFEKIYRYKDDNYLVDERKILDSLDKSSNSSDFRRVKLRMATIEETLESALSELDIAYDILTGNDAFVSEDEIAAYHEKRDKEVKNNKMAGLFMMIGSPFIFLIIQLIAGVISSYISRFLGKLISFSAIPVTVLIFGFALKLFTTGRN